MRTGEEAASRESREVAERIVTHQSIEAIHDKPDATRDLEVERESSWLLVGVALEDKDSGEGHHEDRDPFFVLPLRPAPGLDILLKE